MEFAPEHQLGFRVWGLGFRASVSSFKHPKEAAAKEAAESETYP